METTTSRSRTALTSGYLPLSATLVSDEIYRACVRQSDRIGLFAHGYTYTGHPASCAVALESLDIFEERDLLGHVGRVSAQLPNHLIVRNLQDTIGLCPPLIISEAEVDELLRRFARTLDETAEAFGRP